jgi:hypothetical protein
MRVTAVAAAVLAALALAAPAVSAQPEIERVVVSRSADGVLAFRIEFSGPIVLGEKARLRVAIDTDRTATTGNDGIDYSIDWTGRFPALLEAFANNVREADSSSLDMTSRGNVVTFFVAASELFDLAQFDFYVFADLGGGLGDRASTEIPYTAGKAASTYPRDGTPVPEGDAYPTETYEEAGEAFPSGQRETPRAADADAPETYDDRSDFTLSERGWTFPLVLVGGLLGLGAVAGVTGWSIERWRRRRGVPPESTA